MASITNTYDENNDTVFEVDPGDDAEVALATANTYVDKNIVFKLPENNFIKTVNGTEPDEDGNVEIDVSSSDKMDKTNPIGTGNFYMNPSSEVNTNENSAYGHFLHGKSTITRGMADHAEGMRTITAGTYTHAEGNETYASKFGAHAEGAASIAMGTTSHAEGGYSGEAIKGNIESLDFENKIVTVATTDSSFSIDKLRKNASVIFIWNKMSSLITEINLETGQLTLDTLTNKVAVGDTVSIYWLSGGIAKGQGSHAEGFSTIAEGAGSHAEGCRTNAQGTYSHAEGWLTKAIEDNSHAEGYDTKANGITSHAEGAYSHANGEGSHAEGWYTEANGKYSHSEGDHTIATINGSHVEGKFNITDTTSVHIVGNGTDNNSRSNAHTLDWDGNAWYAGDVYVGSTSGVNKDEGSKKLATEEYVDNALESSAQSAVYINVTLSGRFPNKTVTSVDKTYEEITTLMQSGVNIYLQGDGTYFSLIEYYGDDSYFCFQSIDGGSAAYEYIFIYNDNSYDYSAGNWVKETTLTYELGKKLPIPSYNNGGLFITPNTGQVLSYKSGDLDKSSSYEWTDLPSTDGLASETYVDTKVSDLVNSAPETLDTLNELATALGNDPNFATTVATQIGGKANATDVYTKSESDGKYQPVGDYLTEHQSLENYVEKEEGKGLFSYKAEDITDVGVYQTNLSGELVPVDGLNNQADFNQGVFEQINNFYRGINGIYEQVLFRPFSTETNDYAVPTVGQVLSYKGSTPHGGDTAPGEEYEWIDLPTQSDIEVATVEETLQFLAITIPDLTEEEF